MKNSIQSFKKFLERKLLDGDLVIEWDESLQGSGPQYELTEQDLEDVTKFCYRLAGEMSSSKRLAAPF